MAVSKQAVRNALKGYYDKGMSGEQALNALESRKDGVGQSYREALSSGMTKEQFADTFHISLGSVNEDASFLDKVKSHLVSGAMGVSDLGGGIVQGVAYAGDKANEGINSLFGTHLETHAYDQYNKDYHKANQATEDYRKSAGRTGVDITRTGTNLALQLPFIAAGGGSTLAARMAAQGAIGGGLAAASYAEDGSQRAKNIAMGAIGGALGQGVGEKIIAPVVGKAYNALKGNIAAEYKPLEDLAKKYNVRTSAGDVSRNPIIKKSEVSTEYMPVVGMAGWREAQHGEAKLAAQKIADTQKAAMIETNFRDLPKIQQAAATGDRNAQRILKTIEESGDDSGKILQSSMEVRSWREKQVANKLYDKVGEELQKVGNTTVTPTKSTNLLSNKLDELSKSLAPDDVLKKDLQKIKDAFDDPNVTKDFANMRLLRSQLGEMSEKYATMGTNPNKAGAKFLGDLRQAVENDIGDFVANSGNDAIKTAYKRADNYYRTIMEKQDKAFAKAMDSNKPDEIYSQFIKTGKGDRAANFYNALDQKGQQALRYSMVDEALTKATNESTGHFSPAKFAGEFERMQAPYSNVFKGADKEEMDGFVKLMRHVERAGQYMENPANGNRVANMMTNGVGAAAMGLPAYANAAGVTALAKTLFTTKAGKNLLLASSKLEEGSAGMAKILDMANNVVKVGAGNVGVDNSTPDKPVDTAITETPVTDTPHSGNNQPPSAAPVINGQMPAQGAMPLPVSDAPPAMSINAPMPATSMAAPVATSQVTAPQGDPQNEPQTAPQDVSASKVQAPQNTKAIVENHVKDTLQALIPPGDEQAMQASSVATQQVFSTPQMQQIVTELDRPEPNDTKIKVLQKELSKTDEWKNYVATLPPVEKAAASGADILNLITRGVNMPDNQMQPHF